jgi:RND family efflux transporter MFP subunit
MDEKSSLLNQLRIERKDISPSPPRRKLWWLLGAALVVSIALGIGFTVFATRGVPVRAVAVVAAPVTGSSASNSILDATGYVVARRQATVSAKITGKVIEVLIEEGQRVAQNQIVARLDDTNARAALDQARAQVQQAQANRAAAQLALDNQRPLFERSQKLVQSHIISADAFDNAKIAYDGALSNANVANESLKVAQAVLQSAQVNADDTVVRAPFAGVITVKAAQPGEIISPMSAGGGFTRTGIGTIVDMDSLEVEVDVNESFIGRVRAEQPATITLNAYPDWAIPARLIAVVPTADRAKATVKVRVGFAVKDPRILPEMGAHVSFLSAAPAVAGEAQRPGVIVPTAAVRTDGDKGTVFVIRADTVEKRAVRLGARRSEGFIVLSGLSAGERLAIGDFAALSDGSRIHITDE